MKSGAAWLACAAPEEVDAFLGGLSDNALAGLPWLFEFWALPHQLPPAGDWKTWVIMGGRGAGKTRRKSCISVRPVSALQKLASLIHTSNTSSGRGVGRSVIY